MVTRSALLVAVTFVLAAVALHGDDWHGGTAYAGSRWNLRTVGGAEVPADLGAFVSFGHGNDFRGFDGVNSMVGHYDATAASVRLRDIALTYAAYGGDDPVRRAVIGTMNELMTGEAQVSVTAGRLVIRTTAHEAIFTRGGPAQV